MTAFSRNKIDDDNNNSTIVTNKNDKKIKVMYVTETRAECFCDSACITYNDCCFDYKQFCRREYLLVLNYLIFIAGI